LSGQDVGEVLVETRQKTEQEDERKNQLGFELSDER
jgi:hypothetical protein